MKSHSRAGLLVAGTFVAALLGGCGGGQETSGPAPGADSANGQAQGASSAAAVQEAEQSSNALGMANPATEHCIKLNGTLDYVQGEDGEIIMCHLPDGTVMEEWALYRRDMGQAESADTD